MAGTLIIDNHPLTRMGTRTIVESADGFHACAISGADALAEIQRQRPDVVLIDLDQHGDGLRLLEQLLALPDPPKVAVFADSPSDGCVVAALRMGAAGVILRDTWHDGLAATVQALAAGKTVLCPQVVGHLTRALGGDDTSEHTRHQARHLLASLTNRERQILAMVGRGLSNTEIGRRLFLGTATVKDYVSAILAKLRVRNRLQAALLAYQAGLVRDETAQPAEHQPQPEPVAAPVPV